MATDTMRGCALPLALPPPIPADKVGWQSLAELHALADVEIEQLMSCRVVRVEETWQAEVIASQLREAYGVNDADRLQNLLCLLVRAEVAEGVVTKALEGVTLAIGLRCEDDVALVMASCVRLARLLACKLDAVNALDQICTNARCEG